MCEMAAAVTGRGCGWLLGRLTYDWLSCEGVHNCGPRDAFWQMQCKASITEQGFDNQRPKTLLACSINEFFGTVYMTVSQDYERAECVKWRPQGQDETVAAC